MRKYDIAFKLNAVKLFHESDLTLSEIERDLGIGRGCLGRWVKETDGDNSQQEELSSRDKELVRLKRENALLKEERDILKKALGIFSKNPGTNFRL
jgi:transposase